MITSTEEATMRVSELVEALTLFARLSPGDQQIILAEARRMAASNATPEQEREMKPVP